jgi:hypothetical protein
MRVEPVLLGGQARLPPNKSGYFHYCCGVLGSTGFTAFVCAATLAHRALVAATIRALPSGLSFLFFFPVPTGRPSFRFTGLR